MYIRLLRDAESEVRAVATGNLSKVAATGLVFGESVIKVIEKLVLDEQQTVSNFYLLFFQLKYSGEGNFSGRYSVLDPIFGRTPYRGYHSTFSISSQRQCSRSSIKCYFQT